MMTENPLDKMCTPGDAENREARLDTLDELQKKAGHTGETPPGVMSSPEPFLCDDLVRQITEILRQRFSPVPDQVIEKLKSVNGSARLKELLAFLDNCQSIGEFEAKMH